MATLLILVQVARRAPPNRHIAPPPSAKRAENHPVFKHTLFGSTSEKKTNIWLIVY